MKTIVISAVNLVEAGTLEILKGCLNYLSRLNGTQKYRIVAIVYQRELVDYPNIEYIETQWPKKRWLNRLWYEYMSMRSISKNIGPVYLWFSLHDTTPSVFAERRAVYCHNSFSFYKWKYTDLLFSPKIVAFAIFTKFIYRKNIYKNNYLVVQQNWFKAGMEEMFNIDHRKIIVCPPQSVKPHLAIAHESLSSTFSFLFAGSPNSHKNFEVVCEAAALLEELVGSDRFKVNITVFGDENRYAKWLYRRWSKCKSINFLGFLSKDELFKYYAQCDCLIFPSKVETWGLPISEFKIFDKPMLLADLPYAYETASGANQVSFFHPDIADQLVEQMFRLLDNDKTFLNKVPELPVEQPSAASWEELFDILLN